MQVIFIGLGLCLRQCEHTLIAHLDRAWTGPGPGKNGLHTATYVGTYTLAFHSPSPVQVQALSEWAIIVYSDWAEPEPRKEQGPIPEQWHLKIGLDSYPGSGVIGKLQHSFIDNLAFFIYSVRSGSWNHRTNFAGDQIGWADWKA